MRLYNLREVHQPTDIEEAVRLLRRKDVSTAVLGGGITLVGEGGPEVEAVVDLGLLGLETVERKKGALYLGAVVRLQTLFDDLGDVAHGLLARAAHRTATWHTRNAATVGGTLMSAGGAAPLLVALSVLDTAIVVRDPDEQSIPIGEFLDKRERLSTSKALLTKVAINLPGAGTGHSYAQIGRTPADTPIMCVACQANGDSARLAVGGVWERIVACESPGDPEQAVGTLTPEAGKASIVDDYLGTAAYREAMLPVLVGRAIAQARTQLSE
jgi:CO/xanthine dehydrogenase FAD-binding subunit